MKALIALFLTLFCSLSLFAQNAKIDSLQKVIETTKVDTVRGRSLCRLCKQLQLISEYEAGLKKGGEGLALCEKKNDLKGSATCLNNIGNIYDFQGNYSMALETYQKSYQILERNKDQIGIASCFINIGIIYKKQGNYFKALEYYQKSLKISELIGDKEDFATCLSNIGSIYNEQGNYPKALEYQQKSLKINEQIGDQKGIAACLGNIGNIQAIQGNYPKALEAYYKSLQNNELIGDQIGIVANLTNIGTIYQWQGNYPKALEYQQKSLKIYEQIGDTAGVSISNSNIGSIWLRLKDPLKAKSYAQKGLRLAQEIKHLDYMQYGANVSYQADSTLGDWKSAFEHHKLYKQYSDSLHNEEKAKEFGRIESRYQFEKEAEEAKRKEQEAQRLAQIETERRNNLQYLSIFAGILLIFGGLAFMGRFRIPVRVLDVALFASLLILFEFLLILFDPILDDFTGGIPIEKLIFNSVIALGFAPLHTFLETKLRQRLVSEVKPATVNESVTPPKSNDETDPQ